MPRSRMTAAMSVAGRPGPGTQRARMPGWKNRLIACWTVVTGVAGGAVVAGERALEQPVPEVCRAGVVEQDLGGFVGGERAGDPFQEPVEGVAGEGGGVEVALQHLGGFGGIEPGCGVAGAAGGAGLDGAGGERLGASFGDEGVDAADDRVPDEFGQPVGLGERVEHHGGPVVAAAGGVGQQQVVDLGEGDQRRAGCGEQGRGEQVEGLAGALRADHAGGAVPRAPQVAAARLVGLADPPADLGRVEAPLHRRLLRSRCRVLAAGRLGPRGVGWGSG